MASPAVEQVIAALVAKVEAIVPTIDAAARFARRGETAPATTRNRRTFDVAFEGHTRDFSAEGAGGTQTVGLSDRVAQFTIYVTYPAARLGADFELRLAVDSELVLRALGRSANWNGTPVRKASARTSVDRAGLAEQPGTVDLVVTVDATYRDTE